MLENDWIKAAGRAAAYALAAGCVALSVLASPTPLPLAAAMLHAAGAHP